MSVHHRDHRHNVPSVSHNRVESRGSASSTRRYFLASLGFVLLIVSGAFLIRPHQVSLLPRPSPVSSSLPFFWQDDFSSTSTISSGNSRPVYPYSVIPGGVASRAELLSALANDVVVAAHYADFRGGSAHLIRLGSERRVYVSYRIGDHIYWTRNPVTLHSGELLLTDGLRLARTRCGNRISDEPAEPTSPAEPSSLAMNSPVSPAQPEVTFLPLPKTLQSLATPPPTVFALRNPTPPGALTPPILVPLCCVGPIPSSPSPHPSPFPIPVPGSPPVVTPEPTSLVLLIIGVLSLALVSTLRRD